MKELAREFPDYIWTVDFRPDDDGFATVFYEGGGMPGGVDLDNRYPTYQVYLSSSDWDGVATTAELVYEYLRNMELRRIDVPLYKQGEVVALRSFYLWGMDAVGEPNDLGVGADNVRDFTLNFDAKLTRLKQEDDQ